MLHKVKNSPKGLRILHLNSPPFKNSNFGFRNLNFRLKNSMFEAKNTITEI